MTKPMLFSSKTSSCRYLFTSWALIRYMADEARSLKQYGEIPDTGRGCNCVEFADVMWIVRVNDADVEIEGEEGEMNNEDLITFDNVDGAHCLVISVVSNVLLRHLKDVVFIRMAFDKKQAKLSPETANIHPSELTTV